MCRQWLLCISVACVSILVGCTELGQEPAGPTSANPERFLEDPPACTEDYHVIFARGSSQPMDILEQPETVQFFEVVDDVLVAEQVIRYETLPYDADGDPVGDLEAWASGGERGSYAVSVADGSLMLQDRVEAVVADCGTEETPPWIVLAGYSRGAHVVRESLFLLGDQAKDRLKYVVLFGDPTFVDSSIARGTYPAGSSGLLGGREPQVPAELEGRVVSWCDGSDRMCSGGSDVGTLATGLVLSLVEFLVGDDNPHSEYPYEEMFEAAGGFAESRSVLGLGVPVDVQVGGYEGLWSSLGTCGIDPIRDGMAAEDIFGLAVTISSVGIDEDGIEALVGELDFYEFNPEDQYAPGELSATSSLSGFASEGFIELEHDEWLTEPSQRGEVDVIGFASGSVFEEGDIRETVESQSISPTENDQNCFFFFQRGQTFQVEE